MKRTFLRLVVGMGVIASMLIAMAPTPTFAVTCEEAYQQQKAFCLTLSGTPEKAQCDAFVDGRKSACDAGTETPNLLTQEQISTVNEMRDDYVSACVSAQEETAFIQYGCDILDNAQEAQCEAEAMTEVARLCGIEGNKYYVQALLGMTGNAPAPAQAPTTPAQTAPSRQSQGTAVSQAYAEIRTHGIIFANICTGSAQTPCPCRDDGNCTVSDILQVIVNIINFILAISGTIMLLIMVYAGVRFLTDAGTGNGVTAAKSAISAAVIGLLIIFGSYAIITFFLSVLTGEQLGQDLEDVVDGGQFFETQ